MFNRSTIIALMGGHSRGRADTLSIPLSKKRQLNSSLHPHINRNNITSFALLTSHYTTSTGNSSSTTSTPDFSFADESDTSTSPLVFNRLLKVTQRNRVVRYNDYISYQYLRDYVAHNLLDRLSVIRGVYPNAVDMGCHVGNIMRMMQEKDYNELQGIQHLTQLDSSEMNIRRANEYIGNGRNINHKNIAYHTAIADEEWLPLGSESNDLVLSNLSLHWINDLSSTFSQIKNSLRPDGVFLASLLGGATLQELRSALTVADTERCGGVMPHMSPMVGGADIGELLSSTHFAMPTVDSELVTIKYPDMYTLIEHVRMMGETNALMSRQHGAAVSRDVFLAAAAVYESMYRDPIDGTIPATFQVYYLIGFAPAVTQPKAKRRGSQTASLADFDSMNLTKPQ